MIKRTLLIQTLAAIVIGGIVGFSLGSRVKDENLPSQPSDVGVMVNSRIINVANAVGEALNEPAGQRQIKALRRLSQRLEAPDIPGFLDQLRQQKDPEIVSLQWEVLGEWAMTDPKSALAYADTLEQPLKIEALKVVVTAWGEVDEAAAFAWVNSLSNVGIQNQLEKALINSIGERDLSRFISAMLGRDSTALSVATNRNSTPVDWYLSYQGVWSRWVTRDPRAAIEAAMRLPDAKRDLVLPTIASNWAVKDPRAALAWVLGLPTGEARIGGLRNIVSTLVHEDPAMALKVANDHLVGSAKQDAVRDALYSLARDDRAMALKWVEQLPEGETRRHSLSQLVDYWAQSDPNAALQFALSLPNKPNRSGTVAAALRNWVSVDSESAYRWLSQNGGSLSPAAMGRLVESFSYHSPARSAEILSVLPEAKSNRDYLYQEIGERWGVLDPGKALAHLEAMPEGAKRDKFLLGYVGGIAQSSPAEAGQKVLEMPEGDLRDQLVGKVASTWVTKDPLSAVAWLESVPEGAGRDGAVGSVVKEWAGVDSASAGKYVNSLSPGTTRDAAVQQFARSLTHEDPEGAAIWAVSIGDEKKRESSLTAVMRSWKRADARAAESWIKASSLPPEWKEQMMK